MPKATYPRDSFDDLPEGSGRVGAHRAENPRLRRGLVLLWAAVAVVVLVSVGIVSTLAVSGRLAPPAPAATATRAATPKVAPVVDMSYSVLILNATGKAGLATVMKDKLVKAGWKADLISPGDASADYPTTTVYYAAPKDEAAAEGLAGLVGAKAVVASDKYQPAGDPTARQLTVVLGTGRAAKPSPSASR